jgi:hypothetical protein
MSCAGALAERETGGGRGTLNLDVLVVYEDLETGLKASETLNRTVQRLESPVDMRVDFWRFDLFRDPTFLRQVTKEDADIVFLATHCRGQLPATVNLWFHEWLGHRGGEPRALAVLLDDTAKGTPGAAEMVKELSAAAQPAGVDVFLHPGNTEALLESALDDIHRRAETKLVLWDGVPGQTDRHWFRHWGINE